ncbi:hypothetical protein TNCV_2649441 [Trichonephila clavipes]|nr:hypothetical protein TNCV_2649441 [Trichonephila clavipes]
MSKLKLKRNIRSNLPKSQSETVKVEEENKKKKNEKGVETVNGVKKRRINIVHLDIGAHGARDEIGLRPTGAAEEQEIKGAETNRGDRRTRDQGSRDRQERQKNRRSQKDD